MPNEKNTKKSRNTSVERSGKSAPRRGGSGQPRKTGKGAGSDPDQRRIDPVPESSLFINQLMPFLLIVAALLLTAFFLLSNIDGAVGSVGVIIRDFFCGLFGWPAFIIPLILANLAVFWRKYVDLGIVAPKLWLSGGCLTALSSLVHVFSISKMNPTHYTWSDYLSSIFGTGEPLSNWTYGIRLTGGGFFGGLFGGLVRSAFGFVGALIILFAALVILVLFLFGVTPGYLIDMIGYRIRSHREATADVREERRAERAEIREERRAVQADRRRAAAIEAQMLREDREAALEARRAERAHVPQRR